MPEFPKRLPEKVPIIAFALAAAFGTQCYCISDVQYT
jgi:hypothetical protein